MQTLRDNQISCIEERIIYFLDFLNKYILVLSKRNLITLSADKVNFWSCRWSCGWPRWPAGCLGSALASLSKENTDMWLHLCLTLHKDLSFNVIKKEVRFNCHLSPFGSCVLMGSFAPSESSPSGEELRFTDWWSSCWLLWAGPLLLQSLILCG